MNGLEPRARYSDPLNVEPLDPVRPDRVEADKATLARIDAMRRDATDTRK